MNTCHPETQWNREQCTPVLRSTGILDLGTQIGVTRNSATMPGIAKGHFTLILVCVRHSTLEFSCGGARHPDSWISGVHISHMLPDCGGSSDIHSRDSDAQKVKQPAWRHA